jgi:hypothetical protein
MFWPVLQTTAGKAFMQDLKNAGRKVFVWNINDEAVMKWAIQNECIDGVCTDDPVKFIKYVSSNLQVPARTGKTNLAACRLCEGYTKDWIHVPRTSLTGWAHVVVWNIVAVCLSVYFRWKLGEDGTLASRMTP